MTSPLEDYAPIFRIDGLVVADGLGYTDALGRLWHLEGEEGWSTAAATRANRTSRSEGHGAYGSQAFYDEKPIVLRGAVSVDTPALREQTLLELAAICSDGGRTYTMRRTAGPGFDHVCEVRRAGRPEVVDHLYDIDFTLSFVADDPRKHAATWDERRMTSPPYQATGLDYSDGGLNYGAPGLDYGTARGAAVAQVANRGLAPAAPVFILPGPLTPPRIVHDESGRSVWCSEGIAAGEVVTVNSDDFPARGVLGRRAHSSTRGDVTSLWTASPDWPSVDGQAVANFRLEASGSPADDPLVALRSAWW